MRAATRPLAAATVDAAVRDTEDELPEGYEWDGSTLLGPDGDDVDPDDVPGVEWYDQHDNLAEYPLEVVDERGRNFAVVLCTGGPHIEIEAEGYGRAALQGYWGGVRATLTADVFDRVLDWFIDRVLDWFIDRD